MSTRIMSAILPNNNVTGKRIDEKQRLLSELHSAVKACQLKYGGRTELATEADERIVTLCNCFEAVLSYGLRQQPSSALKQMAELMAGSDPPSFWNFVECQLTSHERERFVSLRQVWTDRGRSRAVIRAAINERSLERYLHCWLGHSSLTQCYEEWAIMRDPEASAMLPNLAAGLVSILFAISVDNVDLNSNKDLSLNKSPKPEPIIAVPPPPVSKKSSGKRHVISFDDEDDYGIISVIPSTSTQNDITQCTANTSQISSIQQFDSKFPAQITPAISGQFSPESPRQPITAMAGNSIDSGSCEEKHIGFYDTADVNSPQNRKDVTDEILDLQSTFSDSGVGDGQFPLAESYGSSSVSSLRGSVDSVESGISPSVLTMLKLKLEEKEERCNWLEARIAELSRENQRLKQSGNNGLQSAGPAFSISIPKVHKVKSHYEYEILITSNHCNESWSILRRYRGFYNLHKDLCKKNSAVLSLDFPPKKTIGNMSSVLVEERRQRLQAYLRHLIVLLPQLICCTTRSQLERTITFFRPEQEI